MGGLEDELAFDVQFSQRGVLNLAHDLGEVRSSMRRVHASRLNGVDAEWLERDEVAAFCPIVNVSSSLRYPVLGATLQRRGGVARHDKVAWAYATRASELGVDIVEHAQVTGFVRGPGGRVEGRDDARHDPGREGRARGRGVHERARRARGSPAAAPVPSVAGVGERPLRARPRLRRDVEQGARVRLAGGQGELVMGAGIDAYNGTRSAARST